MLYTGYFRPYLNKFSNNLETLNETMTLMCTYSLCLFSAFVPDPYARYQCGWQLISLVLLMLGFNLAVIFI